MTTPLKDDWVIEDQYTHNDQNNIAGRVNQNTMDLATLMTVSAEDLFTNPRNPAFAGGAVGDGDNDDYDALMAAFTSAATTTGMVWINTGNYYTSQKLSVPDGVSVQGPGAKLCVIETDQAIDMMQVGNGTGGYGDRNGKVGGFALEGNGVATAGMFYAAWCVHRRFEGIEARHINGPGHLLDATQNCTFIACDTDGCDYGWKVVNDAASNTWLRCETNNSITKGLSIDMDEALPGYALAAMSHQGPSNNTFIKCLYEGGTMTRCVDIAIGRHNKFDNCDFVGYGNVAIEELVYMGTDTLLNTLIE